MHKSPLIYFIFNIWNEIFTIKLVFLKRKLRYFNHIRIFNGVSIKYFKGYFLYIFQEKKHSCCLFLESWQKSFYFLWIKTIVRQVRCQISKWKAKQSSFVLCFTAKSKYIWQVFVAIKIRRIHKFFVFSQIKCFDFPITFLI